MSELHKVIPPVEVYAGVGNPYETSLTAFQKNIKGQTELNNKHGGSPYVRKGYKSKKRERKRVHWGGVSSNTDTRPSQLVVPQAPTGGMESQGPVDGNDISTNASKTMLNSHVNAIFDSLVKVPAIPSPPPTVQDGGSLLYRLGKLNKKMKTRKTKKGKGKKGKKGKPAKKYEKRTVRRRKSNKKK